MPMRRRVLLYFVSFTGCLGVLLITYSYRMLPTIGLSYDDTKLILFWSSYFGTNDFYLGLGKSPFKKCPFKCETSDDKRRFNESDAILIHPRDMPPRQLNLLPGHRFPWQRFVMYLLEPPVMSPPMQAYNGVFNWTMTFRLDSDILNPYGLHKRRSVKERHDSTPDGASKRDVSNKTGLIAWTVSHCQTSSKREKYVLELMKFIPVEIYGMCSDTKNKMSDLKSQKVIHGYKFYLAFENSICKDYVSEKVWKNSFEHGAVPIVLGGVDYKTVLPNHSYIDIADFRSPQHLAEYIQALSREKDEYNKYFKWKDSVTFKNRNTEFREKVFCKLCEKLHDKTEPSKTYDRLDLWWDSNRDCATPQSKYPHLAKYFE